jgi:methyl halide transferase
VTEPPTTQTPATQAVDWEARYREGTTRWERPALHPAFVDWQESGVLAPCRILVPGAGRSTEPQALAEAGFTVTVLDAAPCALPPKLWPDYVARLHDWLRPGGRLFILFMQTGKDGGPPFHCNVAAMRTLFDAAHWGWPAALPAMVPHPTGVGEEQPVVLSRR